MERKKSYLAKKFNFGVWCSIKKEKVDKDTVDKDMVNKDNSGVSISISRTFLELRSSFKEELFEKGKSKVFLSRRKVSLTPYNKRRLEGREIFCPWIQS